MNLDNFRAHLSQIRVAPGRETEIVVPIQRAFSVGGQSCVKIESIIVGFDWDAGKIFLIPEKKLRIIEDDELHLLKKEVEKQGWLEYENQNLKSENANLKNRIKELTNDQ